MSDILKKSRLNWKLKVSNNNNNNPICKAPECQKTSVADTADNAGITQTQACDTRYRRMQELNSLCVSK